MYSEQGLRQGNGDQGTCYFSINCSLAVKPTVKIKRKSHI